MCTNVSANFSSSGWATITTVNNTCIYKHEAFRSTASIYTKCTVYIYTSPSRRNDKRRVIPFSFILFFFLANATFVMSPLSLYSILFLTPVTLSDCHRIRKKKQLNERLYIMKNEWRRKNIDKETRCHRPSENPRIPRRPGVHDPSNSVRLLSRKPPGGTHISHALPPPLRRTTKDRSQL